MAVVIAMEMNVKVFPDETKMESYCSWVSNATFVALYIAKNATVKYNENNRGGGDCHYHI